jgi:hypothetical protein
MLKRRRNTGKVRKVTVARHGGRHRDSSSRSRSRSRSNH